MTTDCWVQVPASTSNLGPGFDVLGMAVDVFLVARLRPGEAPLTLRRTGTLAGIEGDAQEDLLLRAFVETIESNPGRDMGLVDTGKVPIRQGDAGPGGLLDVHSAIPVGRGLGSSAAARVAGHILGLLVEDRPVEEREVVQWVTAREGHPDNAAPAVAGGLVAARVREDRGVDWVSHPVHDGISWVYAAPSASLDTTAARAVLPEAVPHDAAVRTAARMAFLLPALARGDGHALRFAMGDELHVPFRLPLIPGATEARRAGREAGAWAVTLSGAGSGLLAACPPHRVEAVGRAMARAFDGAGGAGGGFHRALRPWAPGTVWGRGDPPDSVGTDDSGPGHAPS